MPGRPGNVYTVRSEPDLAGVAEVRIPADFLPRAKAICSEEIDLIDAQIRKEDIPFPKKIPRQRHKVPFEATLVDRTTDDRAGEEGCSLETGFGQRNRRSLVDPHGLLGFAGLRRLSRLVLAHSRPGPIVIVGEKPEAFALSCFLAWDRRRSIVLTPGYGAEFLVPGYLVRPAKTSLIGWVLDHAEDLDDIGAIVFLGDADFTADIETLSAVHRKPPVLFASSNKTGKYEIPAAHVGGLQHSGTARDNNRLRLSIVIVSYNQVAYLEAAIRSVIGQNYPHLELIIVDGGSTDGSIEIIEKYRRCFDHVVIEPDEGQSDALNKGFSRATGEVMNWLCSDDLLEPGALARLEEAYLATGADLIVGGCVRIGETRSVEFVRHHTALVVGRKVHLDAVDILDFMRSWQSGAYFYQPEVFFSRRIWEASGGYIKKHLYYLMDYDLWLRMALADASVYHIPDMIACSRVHPQQKTRASCEYIHQASQLVAEYQDFFAALEAADLAADQDLPVGLRSGDGC